MSDKTELKGRCLCGAVQLTVSVSNASVCACHCKMCQRWGGGPLLTVRCDGDVRFDGEDNIRIFSSSKWAERGFCSKCGSHLYYHLKSDGHYAVPIGLLDHVDGLVFDEQIFIDEKPPFYSFANDTKNLTGAEVFAQYVKPE